jgi:iron complex outermembrane receptor protein
MEVWSVGLLNRYSQGYWDENTAVAPAFYNKVGSVNTWDLSVTWTGVKNLSITAGVLNMFNQDPPYSNQGSGFQVGYDYRNASPIGRALLLRGTYTF